MISLQILQKSTDFGKSCTNTTTPQKCVASSVHISVLDKEFRTPDDFWSAKYLVAKKNIKKSKNIDQKIELGWKAEQNGQFFSFSSPSANLWEPLHKLLAGYFVGQGDSMHMCFWGNSPISSNLLLFFCASPPGAFQPCSTKSIEHAYCVFGGFLCICLRCLPFLPQQQLLKCMPQAPQHTKKCSLLPFDPR